MIVMGLVVRTSRIGLKTSKIRDDRWQSFRDRMPSNDIGEIIEITVERGKLDVWLLSAGCRQCIDESQLRMRGPQVKCSKHDALVPKLEPAYSQDRPKATCRLVNGKLVVSF